MAKTRMPPPSVGPVSLNSLSREQLLELLGAEGIQITFAGKRNSQRLARAVRPRVTATVPARGVGNPEERSHNCVIEGDNLQAMATLYKERGHVDLILADPPYNTGNDFRYNDRWDVDPNDAGLGNFVSMDDGARHTKWMKFMWPRLQMMRAMLKPTGVLAICIDHRELFRLGQMLDELFGESNRLAIINWQKITSPKNQDTGVSTATEYVLVYAKNSERTRTGRVPRSEAMSGSYRNRDDDRNGEWSPTDSTLMGAATHPGQVYGIQNPFTGRLHYPQQGRCWRNERAKMKAAVEEWGVEYGDVQLDDGMRPALLLKGAKDPRGRAPSRDNVVKDARAKVLRRRAQGAWPRYFWRDDKERKPGAGELRYKTYASEVKEGVVPTTFWAHDEYEIVELDPVSWTHRESGTSDIGVKELNAVVGRGHGFDTVKPLLLFQKIITLWSPTDGLIMDPFAGSGTTGHSILKLNKESGSSRRFILLEQGRPENGDSYARTLLADRLRRVVTGNWKSGKKPALGGGFSFRALGQKVDAGVLLRMERDEMVETVIASHFDATRRRGDQLIAVESTGRKPYRYLVAKNADDEGFFLVWDGPNKNTDLTEEVYEVCAKEAATAGLKAAPYHVYARLYRYQTAGVVFLQIPDRILADFGMDIRSEPFAENDNDLDT